MSLASLNEPVLRFPRGADARYRILVRDADRKRVWRPIDSVKADDNVLEIGVGLALMGNGRRIPLKAFRGSK